MGGTKSGRLFDVFSEPEEREFLLELLEAGWEQSKDTLARFMEEDHILNDEACTPAQNAEDYVAALARQQRKIAFYQLLMECLDD